MRRSIPPALVTLLMAACTGEIGDAPVVIGASDDPAAVCSDGQIRPGASPIRRLTRLEYDNTVRELLRDSTQPAASAFAPDPIASGGFDTEAALQTTSEATVENFEDVAATVAERAVTEARDHVLHCDPAADGCGQTFVTELGRRAFRRPLTAEEDGRYNEFFETARSTYGFDDAMRLTIEAMLQSPHFLYRVESAPSDAAVGDIVPVDAYALATRLSYTLTRSMPDAELFSKAESGELLSVEGLEAEARRLIGSDAARTALHDFFEQWLQLGPLTATAKDNPAFTSEVANAMIEETRLFIDDAIWTTPNAVEALLTGTHTYVNGTLAAFYGIAGPTGETFERVELDPNVRKGVLTRGAWPSVNAGAAKTKPVPRGVFLRRELFCDALGDPPPDAADTVSAVGDDGQPRSVRDSFAAHTASPSCAACHDSIDPLGFAFDTFGATGELRDKDDNGFAVDASGELVVSDISGEEPVDNEATVAFADAAELSTLLAESTKVRNCIAQQQLEFHFGRVLDDDDMCTQYAVESAWAASGYDFTELLVALVKSDAFRYRRITAND